MKGKRMLIRPALTGLLILILAATAGCTTVASSPGQIELSATEFDFGTIPNTEPVSQVFQVRNVGQGWLEITGVSTSCGCTTAEIDSPRLGRRPDDGSDGDLRSPDARGSHRRVHARGVPTLQ